MSQGTCLRTGDPATCGCPCSACSEWVAECTSFYRGYSNVGQPVARPVGIARLGGRRMGLATALAIASLFSGSCIK